MCIFKKPVIDPDLQDPNLDSPIGATELWWIIYGALDGMGDKEIYLSDGNKFLCHYDDIALFLAQDQTNRYSFVSEAFDCDDFAYRLMGQFSIPKWASLCKGIVWTDKHALNCIVDEDKKFWFVEPQNDEIIDKLKSWMGSRIRFVIM